MRIIDAIINAYFYYPDELPILRDLRLHQEAMGSPREYDHCGGVAAKMWWVSLRLGSGLERGWDTWQEYGRLRGEG